MKRFPGDSAIDRHADRRETVATLFFAITLLTVAGFTPAIAGKSPPPTEEQKRASEEAAKLREEQDRLRDEETKRLMRRHREDLEAAERLAAEELRRKIEGAKYTLDPLLAKAMRERLDYEKRDRAKAERMFLEYIEKNPDSPFVAEAYCHIAAMFSYNLNDKREAFDHKKARFYFRKAHKLFGDGVSTASHCAWSHLAVRVQSSLAEKKEYYEWVRSQRDLKPEQVWPHANIEDCLHYSHPPIWSDTERARIAKHTSSQADRCVTAAARHLLLYADLEALKAYARDYPEDELGRQALAKLTKIDSAIADELMKSLDAINPTEPYIPPVSTAPAAAPTTAPATPTPAKLSAQPAQPAPATDTGDTAGLGPAGYAGIAAAIIATGLAGMWLRRRKTAGG